MAQLALPNLKLNQLHRQLGFKHLTPHRGLNPHLKREIMKKNLATRLRERTDTIEYRAIVTKMMKYAQDKRDIFYAMHLQPETIIALQNEDIKVEQIVEFGNKKFKLSWGLSAEEKIASKIKWNVDYDHRHISVPQFELTEAEQNSFVKELRSLGFHIQSAIV